MEGAYFTEVTPDNVREETLFCIKDRLNPGFSCKEEWYNKRYQEGLRISILKDNQGTMIGFIEYVPASMAWRPINADNYLFIHCMYIYPNKNKNKGNGTMLIARVEDEAKRMNMSGVCVMTSKGPWLAGKDVFLKNGYKLIDKKDRFELLSKSWDASNSEPHFINWTPEKQKYNGWQLLYADQCPWHDKSVKALVETAKEFGIEIKVKKQNSAEEAKSAPSGYGVFNLMHNGKLLEDHYISATRFRNIMKKELQLNK